MAIPKRSSLIRPPATGFALLAILAGLILILTLRGGRSPHPGQGFGLERAQITPIELGSVDLRNHPVIYGSIYVDKFYELTLSSRTFTADGSFWLEWPASVQELMNKEGIRPIDLVRLKNRIETWDSTFSVDTEQPLKLSAGRYQQHYTFSSRFYDDEISFRRDPFDILSLPVVIELVPEVMGDKYADVLLLPQKTAGSLVGESGSISGYELRGDSLKATLQSYQHRFGSWHAPKRSQLRLEVLYAANIWTGIINWVLPLMIVNSIVLMAPSVEGSLGDVRLAIPSTALLTLIFLQQSYHATLPRLPYPTFLDDLFSTSYIISMALFALFTWGANTYSAATEAEKERTMARINRTDRIFQIGSCLALFGVMILGWFFK